MKKLVREISKRLAGIDTPVQVSFDTHCRKHPKMLFAYRGQTRVVAFASSPRNEDEALRCSLRLARQVIHDMEVGQ